MTATMDADLARSIWKYDPDTGYFFWLIQPKYDVHVGSRAGNFDGRYWRLRYKKKSYKASRVAWLMMTGEWPEKLIDHSNRDKCDDRWGNLREASCEENARNASAHQRNKLGIKGIHQTQYGYMAQVVHNKKHVLCKQFKTLGEAKAARDGAVKKYHGEFANLEG